MTSRVGNQQGVTLMELMISIAILAILATLAAPSISNTIRNNQIAAQTNELVALVNLARNEAIRRNIPEGQDGVQLILTSTAGGWRGVVRIPSGAGDDEDRTCNIANAIRCAELEDGALGQAQVDIEFNNRGYLNPFDPVAFSLAHTSCQKQSQSRQFTITGVGQISSNETACP